MDAPAADASCQGGPMGKRTQPERIGLIEQLKRAIRGCGRSLNELGKASGVATPQLSRFMRGERTLTLPAVERICSVLHLNLIPEPGFELPEIPPEPRGPGRPRKEQPEPRAQPDALAGQGPGEPAPQEGKAKGKRKGK